MNIAQLKKKIDNNRRNHDNTLARKGYYRRGPRGSDNRTDEIEEREAQYVGQMIALCKELGCPVPEGYGECENTDHDNPEDFVPEMTPDAKEFLDQIHRAGGRDSVMLCGKTMREELGYDHAEVQFCIQTYLTA
jgi:hypothetical protein